MINLIFGREGKYYGNYVCRTNLSSGPFIIAVVCYLRPLLLNVDGLRFQRVEISTDPLVSSNSSR